MTLTSIRSRIDRLNIGNGSYSDCDRCRHYRDCPFVVVNVADESNVPDCSHPDDCRCPVALVEEVVVVAKMPDDESGAPRFQTKDGEIITMGGTR